MGCLQSILCPTKLKSDDIDDPYERLRSDTLTPHHNPELWVAGSTFEKHVNDEITPVTAVVGGFGSFCVETVPTGRGASSVSKTFRMGQLIHIQAVDCYVLVCYSVAIILQE